VEHFFHLLFAEDGLHDEGVGQRVVAYQLAILNKHEHPGDVAFFVLGGLLGDIGIKGRMKTAIKSFAVYRLVYGTVLNSIP
jgi:uncharacterized protein YejL (UPF0352 family)